MKTCAIAFGLLVTSVASATTTVVAPNVRDTVEGSSTFLGFSTTTSRRYMLIINSSELTSLVGMNLTGFSLRLNNASTAAWPPANYTHSFFDVKLSESVAPSARSLTFASNVIGAQTDVRAGSITFGAGSFTAGATGTTPNAFGPMIAFDTPYLYTGGHLAVDMYYSSNTSGAGANFDALANSSDPLANTLVGATWGSYNTTTGLPPTSGSNGNPFVTKWYAEAVPEPFSMAAMGAGLLALARRRRRA